MFKGQGKLIGYRTYKDKTGKDKHIYSVLVGTIDTASGLYNQCEYITVTETEQILKTLKPQEVAFEVTPKVFNGKPYNAYSDIRSIGEVQK